MLYKHLIHPNDGLFCSVWRPAPNSHMRRFQVFAYDLDAPWYIRNLEQNVDAKIPDSENLLVQQPGRYPRDE
jgi:hypothetical protein